MRYTLFTNRTEAEAFLSEQHAQGWRGYINAYSSDRFEVRTW